MSTDPGQSLDERIGAAESLLAAGEARRAADAAAALVAAHPDLAAVHRLAARAALALGDPAAARQALERAVGLEPRDTAGWWQLANLCLNLRDHAAAIAASARVLALAPGARGAHYLAALAHLRQHDYAASRHHCAAALALDPGHWPTRLLQAAMPPDLVTPDEAAARRWLADFARCVDDLARADPDAPGAAQALYEALTTTNDFHAAYLAGDEAIALRRRFGAALARIVTAIHGPQPPLRPIAPAGPRRVLVIGAHLYAHSVTRATGALLEGLAAAGHEVHVLHLSRREDEQTRRLAAGARSYRAGSFPPGTVITLARALDPDVIVYPELGQDPASVWTAATRLAPVQLALWGHPLTSGLPTIDGFASPDAMERAGAEADYCEVLHRLPGLGGAFAPPAVRADPRWRLPLRERYPQAVQFLVAQHALKITPAHDALYARILAGAPHAALTVLVHPAGHARLAARLRPALRAAGVDPARVDVRGPLPPAQFAACARQCDLNLDTIGWSGGISTLDLSHHGLPTLTCPQAALRSRQSMAMMRTLGLDALVARDPDDWVARATTLAADRAGLAALRHQLDARCAGLWGDPRPVTALAALVAQVMPR